MSLLELVDVRASYGQADVLHGISLTLPDNGATGLLGANGAGKTTTLRAISGMVRTTGRIVFDGHDITGLGPDRTAALGIAHVPEGRGTLGQLSVRENLLVVPTAAATASRSPPTSTTASICSRTCRTG